MVQLIQTGKRDLSTLNWMVPGIQNVEHDLSVGRHHAIRPANMTFTFYSEGPTPPKKANMSYTLSLDGATQSHRQI